VPLIYPGVMFDEIISCTNKYKYTNIIPVPSVTQYNLFTLVPVHTPEIWTVIKLIQFAELVMF